MNRRAIWLSPLWSAALAPAICLTHASAQLVAYDGFGEYGGGEQIEQGPAGEPGDGADGGFGWGGPYNVSNAIKALVRAEDRTAAPVTYAAGEVAIDGGSRALRFYDFADGTYAVRRPLGISFEAGAGDELWFSFLFRTNNGSPLPDQDFFQIGFDDNPDASAGNPRASIGATTPATAFPPDQPFQFFARSTTAVANSAFASAEVLPVTTYLLAGRIAPIGGRYGIVDLFVNPASASVPGEPDARAALDSGIARLTHLFIRTARLDAGDAYVFDELKVGRDFASAVLARPPEFSLSVDPAPHDDAIAILRWLRFLDADPEVSTSLLPGSWSPLPGPPAMEGDFWTYRVTPGDAGGGRAFYRLKRRGF